MQQYILQKYTKFRLIHFGSVSNCRYRSIQTQVSFFQHSTIAALYKKAQGCAEGRGLVPLCGFLTFQCDLPSAGPQPMCHTAGGRSLCGYTTGVPQSMRHIRPGFRNPCGHSAGASAAHAVIISPYKIKKISHYDISKFNEAAEFKIPFLICKSMMNNDIK